MSHDGDDTEMTAMKITSRECEQYCYGQLLIRDSNPWMQAGVETFRLTASIRPFASQIYLAYNERVITKREAESE